MCDVEMWDWVYKCDLAHRRRLVSVNLGPMFRGASTAHVGSKLSHWGLCQPVAWRVACVPYLGTAASVTHCTPLAVCCRSQVGAIREVAKHIPHCSNLLCFVNSTS